MCGAVVRNCREWIRLVSVFFPRELLPPAMAYVQARPALFPKQCCLTGNACLDNAQRCHFKAVFVRRCMCHSRKSFGLDEASSMWVATLPVHVGIGSSDLSLGDWLAQQPGTSAVWGQRCTLRAGICDCVEGADARRAHSRRPKRPHALPL